MRWRWVFLFALCLVGIGVGAFGVETARETAAWSSGLLCGAALGLACNHLFG